MWTPQPFPFGLGEPQCCISHSGSAHGTLPCLRPQHSPLGRFAEVEDAPRTQAGKRAHPLFKSAKVVPAHLSDRPNWPTFHSRSRTANRRLKLTCPTTVPIVRPSNCVSAEVLNIAAARVAPRRAGRQAELPDRQPADAAELRSPHAAQP